MDEATHKKNFKPVNIRDLFMVKNPKVGRWIPGFVYRFLSRMLRIDFMNDPILYNLANLRKFLKIKVNLEMFFLPNESYKHRNKHFVITFGKPIPYQTFDKRFTPVQWAARVKDFSYTLAENPEGVFSDIN